MASTFWTSTFRPANRFSALHVPFRGRTSTWAILSPVRVHLRYAGGFRTLDKGHQTSPRKKRPSLLLRWASRPYFLYHVGGLALLIGGFYAWNSESVPISGRRRFNVFSSHQEREMATAEYEQIIDQFKSDILPPWHPQVIRVKRVLARLIAGLSKLEAERNVTQGDKKAAVTAGAAPWCREDGMDAWTLHVVNAPIVNAMVLPGNKVFIFTEMLKICENDAAIATVLGHEIAHNICHHAAERMSSQSIYWIAVAFFAILVGDFTFTSGIALNLLWQKPMGRTQESEADQVGMLLMAASCYDPRHSLLFWQRMSQITDAQRAKVPEFFSTHPNDRTRVRQLEGWMDGALVKYDNSDCAPTGQFMQGFFKSYGSYR